MTAFSAASFRLLALGFHGLCTFFWQCDPYINFVSLFCLLNIELLEGKACVSVMEK